jgi:Nnf1
MQNHSTNHSTDNSINVGRAQGGAYISGQVTGNVTANSTHQSSQEEEEEVLSQADVIALLAELEKLVREAQLSQDAKEEAIMYLGAAQKATAKEQPKKETALANLQGVAETLETASKAANASANLWDKTKPIILKIAGWLGATAGSYFLGL